MEKAFLSIKMMMLVVEIMEGEGEGDEEVDDQNNIFLVQSRENRGNGRDVSINHNDDDYVDIYIL